MASNTDILAALNEVIDKLDKLDKLDNFTCPQVSVNMPAITVACGCSDGIKPEDPQVSQGDTPPIGFEPDPNIANRKCKAANYVYDRIYGLIVQLDLNDVGSLASVSFGGATGLISALALANPYGAAVAAVVGTAVGIITALLTAVGWNLDDIKTALENGHTELVCALYNAQDTTQAKNDFIAELQNQGLNDAEALAFTGFFLVSDALKILFQAIPGSEAVLDGYSAAVDCGAACGACQNIWLTKGTQIGNSITAEYQSSVNLYQIEGRFNWDGGEFCGANVTLSISVTSGTAYWEAGGQKTFRVRDQSNNIDTQYNSHTPPVGISGAIIYFWSTSAFTIDLTVT